jgi:hypothetical protein
MWAVIVKPWGASDISVNEARCLDEIRDYLRRDDQIVGVRLMPRTGFAWWWNKPVALGHEPDGVVG